MKRLVYILLLLLLSYKGAGQYSLIPSLSNFHLTWTNYNPGFTGYRELATGSMIYRSKLYGIAGPVDFQLNAHSPVGKGSEAVGLIISNSRTENSNNDLLVRISAVMGSYTHRFRVGGGHLSLGLSGGMYQVKEDYKSLSLRDPKDPAFNAEELAPVRWFPNFGVGGVYYDKKLFVGLSIPELFSMPNSTKSFDFGTADFSNYRFILIGAYYFEFNEYVSLKPALFVDYNRSNTKFKISTNFGIMDNMFYVGGVYDYPNYAVALVNIPFKLEKYMIGFAYTFPLSDIAKVYSGSWEVVLRYEWRNINKTPEPNPFYF